MEKKQVSAILKEKEADEKWRKRIRWFIFIALILLILVMASSASILLR